MNYDVTVVGAGPAGSTAAKVLSEHGVKVLLLDKKTFPRVKPCAGLLSMRTLKRFPYVTGDLIASYTYGGRIYSSSLKQHIQVQKEKPIAVFVKRSHFDHGLVKLAIEQGTVFKAGVSATDVQIQDDKATVKLSDGESVQSEIVIGADGVWSVVAKKTGLQQQHPSIGRCLYQEIPVAGDVLDEYFTENKHFQIYLKFMGIDGFAWVTPKNDCLNIGIGEIQPKTKRPLNEVYRHFIAQLKERNAIPPTISSGTIQGGCLPLRPLDYTYANRVVLCGDAAGQMNPLTGDGIHYAMSAGKFAADVCAKALDASTPTASFLSQYQTLWTDDFGGEITLFARVLKMLLKGNRDEKYIRLLSQDSTLLDDVLTIAETDGKIQQHQWKIIRRFASLYVKDLFGLRHETVTTKTEDKNLILNQ
jgi:geranylgeranyl reductase family protein